MTILVNSLGDDYPTFPQFQRMLREYERNGDNTLVADWFTQHAPPSAPSTNMRGRARWATTGTFAPNHDFITSPQHQPHRIRDDAPEVSGQTHQCELCGKWFTGGQGAICHVRTPRMEAERDA